MPAPNQYTYVKRKPPDWCWDLERIKKHERSAMKRKPSNKPHYTTSQLEAMKRFLKLI